ncbi:MAG: imidazolonepropionase, partial [Acidobacteria bacterium]|nr:imidazolonepropionase [Acidobacteriota bacterium]
MLLIKDASQVVTVAGPPGPRRGRQMDQLEIISGGSVLVANGKVAEVGREVSEPRGARVLNLRGKALLMPGFVDSHTHAVFAGTREEEYDLRCRGSSYQEIARRGGGILSSVRRVRDASLEALCDYVRPHLLTLLQHGTTTAEVKSGYGLTT